MTRTFELSESRYLPRVFLFVDIPAAIKRPWSTVETGRVDKGIYYRRKWRNGRGKGGRRRWLLRRDISKFFSSLGYYNIAFLYLARWYRECRGRGADPSAVSLPRGRLVVFLRLYWERVASAVTGDDPVNIDRHFPIVRNRETVFMIYSDGRDERSREHRGLNPARTRRERQLSLSLLEKLCR